MKEPIALGDLARDTVTGFQGIVIARCFWLQGCVRSTLQPQALTKDGKPIEAQTFDELQLELRKKRAVVSARQTGGPRPEPTRERAPQ